MAPHNKAEPAYAVKPGGAHAVGPLQLIQGENEPYAGWEQRPAAVAEFGRRLHFPMFGWAHTKLRKQGGGGAFNGAFLAVRVINPADDTYGALVEGFWILEKDDLPKAYKKWSTILHLVGKAIFSIWWARARPFSRRWRPPRRSST